MAEHTNPFQDETDAYRRDLDALLAELPGGAEAARADAVGTDPVEAGETPNRAAESVSPVEVPEKERPEAASNASGLKRLRARRAGEADSAEEKPRRPRKQPDPDAEQRRAEEKQARRAAKKERRRRRRAANRSASAQLLSEHPMLRSFLLGLVTVVVVLVMVLIALSKLVTMENATFQAIVDLPEKGIAAVMSPLESAFSGITSSVADLFYRIRLSQNIEEEYEKLREEYEQIVYDAALSRELQIQLSQFENIYDEIAANTNMQPLVARVINREEGNYFSVFTINRGTNDGVEPYMAVTISGALIGYTETVNASSATVRTIIDSEASIAALIQSSRDQGTVRGTLGIDGTAMCRMYYLPDDHLPRPGDVVVTSGVGMSFPKGIPIGTVRESTRGMESNKQYIVVEPTADFQHLEYVIVLRYQPEPEAVQSRSNTYDTDNFETLAPADPVPTIRFVSINYFGVTATPSTDEIVTPEPTDTPEPTPTPDQTPMAIEVPTPTSGPVFVYVPIDGNPTATPTVTPTPSPTPFITISPDSLTIEED